VLFAGGSFVVCYLIVRYCKKKKIKCLIDVVDEISKLDSEDKLTILDRIAIFNKKLFEKFILPRIDAVFVISSYLEKKYKKAYNQLPIKRSVPSLIDFNNFKKNESIDISGIKMDGLEILYSEKIKFAYAGSVVRTNGIRFFLECAAQLKNEHKFEFLVLFFIVIGNPEKITSICRELDIESNVAIFPCVLHRYLPAIYKHADILFLPEHGDVVANAGFPGKTAELLASGKPVLSTVFSDLTEYLIHEYNAMLANIGDHKKYIENMRRVLIDRKLKETLSKNAIRTAVERFDYKQCVKPFIEEIYS
jgi:glycosyltransferase involved in cell wall biosynthesis